MAADRMHDMSTQGEKGGCHFCLVAIRELARDAGFPPDPFRP